MEVSSQKGSKRLLLKLDRCLNDELYYEAHQLYRTLHFRMLAQKQYTELIQLLYSGSLLLLQREQFTCGADLGSLLIDVLRKSKVEPSPTYFQKLIDLFALMNPGSPERETFVQNAIKWSTTGSNYKSGHPTLHQQLAEVYWREKNYTLAKQHFLHTKDGSGCASMLVELHEQQGYSCEVELFITHTVLQYLCLKNKDTANQAFKSYISQHPKIKGGGPPFILPLLNFLFFLLKIIETENLSVFTILCDRYITSLDKDPSFVHYLEKIGQIFFKARPIQTNNRGFLSSLLQSFFNDFEEEESSTLPDLD